MELYRHQNYTLGIPKEKWLLLGKLACGSTELNSIILVQAKSIHLNKIKVEKNLW